LVNCCFIGAGAAALFSQLLHWKPDDLCLYGTSGISGLPRRRDLEINKLFGLHARSHTSVTYALSSARLHDRLAPGGNSAIWGGFIDVSNNTFEQTLSPFGISLTPLSWEHTGSSSNWASLCQLQDGSGRILDASRFLRPGVDAYVTRVMAEHDRLRVFYLSPNETAEQSVLAKTVVAATGVIQTIDLLFRSGLLSNGDLLTLDEHRCSYSVRGHAHMPFPNDSHCVIRYAPVRALLHAGGIQRKLPVEWLTAPVVDQVFSPQTSQLKLRLDGGTLTELGPKNPDEAPFGGSIHYNNLRVNGIPINVMLRQNLPGLFAIGMAGVTQDRPGPISNYIFELAQKVLA
jgi:hypothetical protein